MKDTTITEMVIETQYLLACELCKHSAVVFEMKNHGAVFEMGDLHELLFGYESELTAAEACKDEVGAVNKKIALVVRKASALMQSVHHCQDRGQISDICDQTRESLMPLADLWGEMHDKLDGRHSEL